MAALGIYVESFIRCDLDEVWRLTQTPEVHQRWDLRFTTIEYLPRESLMVPQRFLYVTRLVPGLAIKGTGQSVGERIGVDGNATSALTFGSEQWWSLIRTGSGYWRYVPVEGGVRFLTWYDYEVRFGWVGRVVNAWVLRPAMGWATAWSFDRLRLWVEEGQTPEVSMALATVQTVVRGAIGLVWVWHGLVPKLLFHDVNERIMLAQAGLAGSALPWVGWGEVVFGLVMLAGSRWPWLFAVNIALMVAALLGVVVRSPAYLSAAFNPVTLNGCVIALSVVGLIVSKRVPSARFCLRRRPKGEE
jgi:DoxX-like family